MSTYKVLRKLDGVPIYVYNADAPIEWSGMEFAYFDHVLEGGTEAFNPLASIYGGRRTITKQEFYDLLGSPARQAILSMMKQSAEVEDWFTRFTILSEDQNGYSIDLDDPRVSVGLYALESILLAQNIVETGWAEGVLNG